VWAASWRRDSRKGIFHDSLSLIYAVGTENVSLQKPVSFVLWPVARSDCLGNLLRAVQPPAQFLGSVHVDNSDLIFTTVAVRHIFLPSATPALCCVCLLVYAVLANVRKDRFVVLPLIPHVRANGVWNDHGSSQNQSGDAGGNDRQNQLAGQLLHEPVQKIGLYSLQWRAASPELTSSSQVITCPKPLRITRRALGAALCCAAEQYLRLLFRPPAKAEPFFITCGLVGNRHGEIAATVTGVCLLNDKSGGGGCSPH